MISTITNYSYLYTFLLLSFTTFITGLEALKTTSLQYRITLTLETFVSLVAGYIYYKYLLNSSTENTTYRYIDWSITTPFLLLSLIILLVGPDNFNVPLFTLIIGLNFAMLIFGYLAEKNYLNKYFGWILSSLCLILIFVLIYINYAKESPFIWIFWTFFIIWLFYGLAFFLSDKYKSLTYNILDLFAKVLFGLITWAYAVELL